MVSPTEDMAWKPQTSDAMYSRHEDQNMYVVSVASLFSIAGALGFA